MRLIALTLAALATTVACGACSAAEDTVDSASSAAKSAAAAEVKRQVQAKICDLVADGRLSDGDRKKLSGLLEDAQSLSLPDELLEPARELAERGASAKQDVAELRDRCSAG